MLSVKVQFQIETLYSDGLKHLNASTHQSIVESVPKKLPDGKHMMLYIPVHLGY